MTAGKQIYSPCSHCRRTNHAEKDCWYKHKPSFKCSFCNNLVHSEKFCRAKNRQPHQPIQQQVNVTEEEKED